MINGLIEFSLTLMSHIVTFSDKTIKETNDRSDQTDSILKANLEKVEYEEIQISFPSNETATKKILHQRRFKEYNNLKYKAKLCVKATNIIDENENLKNATYAEILRANIKLTREISKTDNTDHNNKQNIQEKLRSLSLTNRNKRQRNIPSRKLSNSNIQNSDKHKQKINELQEEIQKTETFARNTG